MSSAVAILAALVSVSSSTVSPQGDDETVIIMDDESWPDSADADVIDLSSSEGPSQPEFSIKARASAQLDLRMALDTSFDRAGEQIAELSVNAKVVLDVDLSPSLRVYAAPKLAWMGALDREGDDRELLLTRAPEAYLGWTGGAFMLRAGYLVFDWGQSEVVGPNDVLNPPDLRQGVAAMDADIKIPVPGAEVVASLGKFTLRGVVVPVFVPGRFQLTGWDLSAAQGGLIPGGSALADEAALNPAYIDRIGDELLQTERPRDRPDNATLGFRAGVTLDSVDLAASVVHGWNPFPSMTVDPNLLILAERVAQSRIRGEPPPLDDPEVAGALLNLQNAAEAGAPLFKGKYERRTIVGADAAWALDPFILKLDVAYNTKQVSYTPAGQARATPAFTGVVGAEYYRGEQLQVWVELFVQRLFDIAGPEPIAYVESQGAAKIPGRSATWMGGGLFARYQLWDGDLAFELGALFTSRRDFTLLPRVTYRVTQMHRVNVGGLLVEGQADGLGGAYSHLDQVYVGYTLAY